MTWIERIDKRQRRSKTWQDDSNPRRFALDATLAPLHYETILDSAAYDTPIDCTPVRVDKASFDGWRISSSGWHYALGKDIDVYGQQDGWAGYGGRQGQHWFKFRLLRVGYRHWPTRSWHDIGGPPTYDRSGLSRETKVATSATDGSSSLC